MLLEGPYGGTGVAGLGHAVSDAETDTNADSVVIVAGGSGGGFALGILNETLRLRSSSSSGRANGTVKVVFACRSTAMARWFREESEALISSSSSTASAGELKQEGNVVVDIHDTSVSSTSPSSSSSSSLYHGKQTQKQTQGDGTATGEPDLRRDKELEPDIELLAPDDTDTDRKVEGKRMNRETSTQTQTGLFYAGRPDLPARIAEVLEQEKHKRVAIYACGPASMLFDVRNAAADAQRRRDGGEVVLHTETFSW